MPTTCVRFAQLQSRASALAAKFVHDQAQAELANLPFFNPDLDKLAAYRLLVHAEIEEFIESKAKDRLIELQNRISAGISSLGACPGLIVIASILKKPLPVVDAADARVIKAYLSELVAAAIKAVEENNSVKSPAFFLLSLCAGKSIEDVDQVLSGTLNSFGKNRGDVAHRSITRCSSIRAPSAEMAEVQQLVQQLGVYYDVQP